MTDREEFKKLINAELKGLSTEQIQFFAWLCAVRALPFLGAAGDFNYWNRSTKGDRRRNHLMSVLWILDVVAPARATIAAIDDAADAFAFDNADAFDDAADAFDDDADDADDDAAATAAATATATATVAVAAFAFAFVTAAVTAADAAADAAAVAAAVAAADATDAFAIYAINIESILQKDLKLLQAGREDGFAHDVSIYGEVWENFHQALEGIGCAYWGRLYANLFAKGFVMDEKDKADLERRLSVPEEIREQGAEEVARYLMDLESQGARRLNEARIILLGEKGAGKTSLAKRLIDPNAPMPKNEKSTEGVDVGLWEIPGNSEGEDSGVNAHIWDFAGHVITHAVHRCFLSERCLYILVYNGRIERDNRPTYWLDQMKTFGGDSPVLVLVNLQDGHMPDIPENTLREKYPSIIGFFPVDIKKDREKLEDFRQKVIDLLRDRPSWKRQEIPARAYQVKEALQGYFHDNQWERDSLSLGQFNEIAQGNGVPEGEMETLLNDLDVLGICLRFNAKKMAGFDTLVLNPGWVSNGIYTLINWGYKNKKHILSVEDGEAALGGSSSRYPEKKLRFLFKIMENYELGFMPQRGRIFVPLLLPEDQPETLPDFVAGDRLRLQYVANQPLPPNTVSRLIVQRHKELGSTLVVWRYGAVLHAGETTALVREDEREITITVEGPDKKNYLSELRAALDEIFNEYKSDKPELRVEVFIPEEEVHFTNRTLLSRPFKDDGLMLPEQTVRAHVEQNQPYLVPSTGELISLFKTFKDYNIQMNNPTFVFAQTVGQVGSHDDHSVTQNIQFNFKDCNVSLQGELNDLTRRLQKQFGQDDEDAAELVDATAELEAAQEMLERDGDSDAVKEKIQKRGLLNKIKRICEDFGDENSELYKKTVKIRRGIKTAQEIAKLYNDIAQWVGMPQVPTPLLGEQGKAPSLSTK